MSVVFSKVLVQFTGVVLIKDGSESDVAAPTQEENVSSQENSEEGTKSKTAEEKAAEENGETS